MVLEDMAAFFEARIDGYDEHMLADIVGAREFYPLTASLLPRDEGARILDLGCGTGLELDEYYRQGGHAHVTGIDLTTSMLKTLRLKHPDKDIELIEGSYFNVPFGSATYDAVVSVESLHHFTVGQKLGLYRKVHDALVDGGVFVLTDYFAESDEAEIRYREELQRLREAAGVAGDGFFHYDTPLTLGHETAVLREAGFSDIEVRASWEATSTLVMRRDG